MDFKLGEMLYEGKAKKIYNVKDSSDHVAMVFKNSLTAFNGEKKDEREGKGELNAGIARMIFDFLAKKGVKTHYVSSIDKITMVCKKVDIIPLEVVVRNIAAGSFAKKFKKEEGELLSKPLVEFFYKDDDLGDPFISDEQALLFGLADNQDVLEELKTKARHINQLLISYFDSVGITLVDFKLEFGLDSQNEILLGDEITPDSCRLWDKETNSKFDKDVFRRDLGDVLQGYKEVFNRLSKVEEN